MIIIISLFFCCNGLTQAQTSMKKYGSWSHSMHFPFPSLSESEGAKWKSAPVWTWSEGLQIWSSHLSWQVVVGRVSIGETLWGLPAVIVVSRPSVPCVGIDNAQRRRGMVEFATRYAVEFVRQVWLSCQVHASATGDVMRVGGALGKQSNQCVTTHY